MTKLEDLIYSLATMIVCYYEPQYNNPHSNPRKAAIDIIQNTQASFKVVLQDLIDKQRQGSLERKPFFTFLLNELIFLKTQQDRTTSFSDEEFQRLQQQIKQLLIDSQQLLKTSKGQPYEVTCSSLESHNATLGLEGLINTAWVGEHFCYSGTLLVDKVLGRFRLEQDSSEEEISILALSMCQEHQNKLLVSELSEQKSILLAKIKEQETTLRELGDTLADLKKQKPDHTVKPRKQEFRPPYYGFGSPFFGINPATQFMSSSIPQVSQTKDRLENDSPTSTASMD